MSGPRPGIVGVGIYTIPEAGRIVRAHRSTVAAWVRMGIGATPLYEIEGAAKLITFVDLISLLVVRALRRAEPPVAMRTIKEAERTLQHEWGIPKPFASARIRTGYGAVIAALREGERPVAVADALQELLIELIEHELANVSYDAEQEARAWRPAAYVLLRPEIQFGAPCIEGTRIPTRTVHTMLLAGETPQDLAEDFGVTDEQIAAADTWERSLAKAA